MLVILSDLHLNDGTTGPTLSPGAMSLFAERLAEMALAASWRADGAYRPIERIDLVLLGDVLDLIHSARWAHRPTVRPWSDPHATDFVDQIGRITGDILAQNQESIATLRGLSADGAIVVPPMLRAARPAASGDGQPVSVRIYYMVGNHDWFFHLPGPSYDALRQTLVEQMGLANRADRPLPHDIFELDDLLLSMRRHKVTARHGDIHDPLCFEGDRDASSLGDVLTIELVDRFVSEADRLLGADLPDPTVLALREIDAIRPILLVPAWLEGVLERTCPAPSVRKRARLLWDRLVDDLLASEFIRRQHAMNSAELIDGLAQSLKFGKRLSSGWTSVTLPWLRKIRGAAGDSYCSHALAEQDFRNRRAKHVVYGHTHAAELVPLEASHAEGYVLDQTYFNVGTWRRAYRPMLFSPGENEFVALDQMSYLTFYQSDERKGRPLEMWTGTLGHSPADMLVRRIDANHPRPAASHAPSLPSQPKHAPHFARSRAEQPVPRRGS